MVSASWRQRALQSDCIIASIHAVHVHALYEELGAPEETIEPLDAEVG